MAEYLYILIEREMIRLGESTVKIGKTGRTPEKRLKEYPNGSKLLGSVPVGDCNIAEKALICVFKSKFVQKTEYGVEYFNGNMDDMLGTFYDISNTFRTKSSSMYHAFGRDIESDDTEPDNNLVSEPLIILNGDINTTIIDGDINNTNNTNNISGDCCTGKTVSKVTVIKKPKIVAKKSEKKNIRDFCTHIYETKPEWYVEGGKVEWSIIEESYRTYFDDHTTPRQTISQKLNGTIFKKGGRSNIGTTTKRLFSYDDLKKNFGL